MAASKHIKVNIGFVASHMNRSSPEKNGWQVQRQENFKGTDTKPSSTISHSYLMPGAVLPSGDMRVHFSLARPLIGW